MGRRRETQITRNVIASINALFRLLKVFTGAPGMRRNASILHFNFNNISYLQLSNVYQINSGLFTNYRSHY